MFINIGAKMKIKLLICLSLASALFMINGCKSDDGNPVNTVPEEGTLSYGGKIYHNVVIGTQTWLKENLDVGTMIPAGQNPGDNSTIEKYCYNDDPNNCAQYGGLYQWNEAMAYRDTPGSQGVCPDGYHIPTSEEFHTLATTVGNNANALKAIGQGTGVGAGNNASGFSGLLGGMRYAEGSYFLLTMGGYFWHSTIEGENQANSSFYTNNNNQLLSWVGHTSIGLSIRCIRNW